MKQASRIYAAHAWPFQTAWRSRPAGRRPALRARWAALAWAAALAVAPPGPALAEPSLPAGLVEAGHGTVAEITDGDTLSLSDGREIRLVGIQAPKLPLGRVGFKAWPKAEEARATLERIAAGRRVTLHYGGARRDRHGRWLAHLERADGLWIQGRMLAAGMARVYSFPDNRAAIAEMLAEERRARAAKRGIWDHPFYRVLSAAELEREGPRYVNGFQIVEGRVEATAVLRRYGYVNFGPDWRRDFTISIDRRDLAPFREAFGANLESLEGRRIRVRGWIRELNGPMIEATHIEQIENIEETGP